MRYCRESGQDHRYRSAHSEKMRFFRHLRAYLIVNLFMFFLTFSNGGNSGWWKASMIWGAFVAIQYVRVYGWPGTNGWLGRDWEEWMEERERRRFEAEGPGSILREERPEPIIEEERPRNWRNKDLV